MKACSNIQMIKSEYCAIFRAFTQQLIMAHSVSIVSFLKYFCFYVTFVSHSHMFEMQPFYGFTWAALCCHETITHAHTHTKKEMPK